MSDKKISDKIIRPWSVEYALEDSSDPNKYTKNSIFLSLFGNNGLGFLEGFLVCFVIGMFISLLLWWFFGSGNNYIWINASVYLVYFLLLYIVYNEGKQSEIGKSEEAGTWVLTKFTLYSVIYPILITGAILLLSHSIIIYFIKKIISIGGSVHNITTMEYVDYFVIPCCFAACGTSTLYPLLVNKNLKNKPLSAVLNASTILDDIVSFVLLSFMALFLAFIEGSFTSSFKSDIFFNTILGRGILYNLWFIAFIVLVCRLIRTRLENFCLDWEVYKKGCREISESNKSIIGIMVTNPIRKLFWLYLFMIRSSNGGYGIIRPLLGDKTYPSHFKNQILPNGKIRFRGDWSSSYTMGGEYLSVRINRYWAYLVGRKVTDLKDTSKISSWSEDNKESWSYFDFNMDRVAFWVISIEGLLVFKEIVVGIIHTPSYAGFYILAIFIYGIYSKYYFTVPSKDDMTLSNEMAYATSMSTKELEAPNIDRKKWFGAVYNTKYSWYMIKTNRALGYYFVLIFVGFMFSSLFFSRMLYYYYSASLSGWNFWHCFVFSAVTICLLWVFYNLFMIIWYSLYKLRSGHEGLTKRPSDSYNLYNKFKKKYLSSPIIFSPLDKINLEKNFHKEDLKKILGKNFKVLEKTSMYDILRQHKYYDKLENYVYFDSYTKAVPTKKEVHTIQEQESFISKVFLNFFFLLSGIVVFGLVIPSSALDWVYSSSLATLTSISSLFLIFNMVGILLLFFIIILIIFILGKFCGGYFGLRSTKMFKETESRYAGWMMVSRGEIGILFALTFYLSLPASVVSGVYGIAQVCVLAIFVASLLTVAVTHLSLDFKSVNSENEKIISGKGKK